MVLVGSEICYEHDGMDQDLCCNPRHQIFQAQTQNDEKEARLKVAKAERGDTGKYTIKVANLHGEDTADINVIVLGQFLSCVALNLSVPALHS